MRVTIVLELNIEGLPLAHGGRHILGPSLSARSDHRPADLVVQFRQPADEIAGKVKALRGRDAGRGRIDGPESRARARHDPKLRFGHNS